MKPETVSALVVAFGSLSPSALAFIVSGINAPTLPKLLAKFATVIPECREAISVIDEVNALAVPAV